MALYSEDIDLSRDEDLCKTNVIFDIPMIFFEIKLLALIEATHKCIPCLKQSMATYSQDTDSSNVHRGRRLQWKRSIDENYIDLTFT